MTIREIFPAGAAAPCLFYPEARRMGRMPALFEDARAQADVLRSIAQRYSPDTVIRMSELWCEGVSFGMDCAFSGSAFPRLGEPLCTEAEELEDIAFPNAFNAITETMIEAVWLASRDARVVAGVTGPFTLASVLNGSENFMVNCLTEPELAQAFLDRLCAFLIELIGLYRKAGAACVMLAEPSTAMLSPDMAREFSCAAVRRVLEAATDDAFPAIYHNCGAVDAQLPDIAKLPARAFHFGSAVDMGKALRLMPEDALVMGNLEPQHFLTSSRAQIEAETRAMLAKWGAHANYVPSTGCDLAPGARAEAIDGFFDALRGGEGA